MRPWGTRSARPVRRHAVDSCLRPPTIKETTDKVLETVEEMARVRPTDIHLKLKDYIGSGGGLVLEQKYYKTSMNSLKSVLPNSPVWLFTDDVILAKILWPEDVTEKSLKLMDKLISVTCKPYL